MTARQAVRRILPGAVKTVRVLFQASDGHVSALQAPKVRVVGMLKRLPPDTAVEIDWTVIGEALVIGALAPIRAGELESAR